MAQYYNIFEYLRKFPGIKVQTDSSGDYRIRFLRYESSTFLGSSAPLIVIDDIPQNGEEAGMKMLSSIPIDEILYVNTLKGAETSFYGVNGGCGVILVYTRRGFISNKENTIKCQQFNIEGFYTKRNYYCPNYETDSKNNNKLDLRSSIYWNPNIHTDKKGHAEIEVYS